MTFGVIAWSVVWESDENLFGAIGPDSDILTAVSVDGGVTWTPTFPLNTNAATDSGDDVDPQMTTD